MFRRTPPLSVLISTHGGQRRILKRPIPTVEYIRMAVESGVYRTNEEMSAMLRDRRLQEDPVKQIMKRFRQDIIRGASVQDYPFEYLVLRQNPPPPFAGYVPVRLQKEMDRMAREKRAKEPHPVQALVKQYLRRQNRQNHQSYEKDGTPQSYENGAPLTSEEYYRRLLGVPKPPELVPFAHKTGEEQKAYASALKHYQLIRTKGISDEEAMAEVDALLKQASQDELHKATEVLKQAQMLRQKPNEPSHEDDTPEATPPLKPTTTALDLQREHEEARDGEPWRTILDDDRPEWLKALKPQQQQMMMDTAEEESEETRQTRSPQEEMKSREENKTTLETVFTNVLGSEPNVMEGMMRWSERLKAVPYAQWTVGASVALDHWLARQVLKFSEETWQFLLEGGDAVMNDPTLSERSKLVVQAREAMFPETILHESPFDNGDDEPLAELDLGERMHEAQTKHMERMSSESSSPAPTSSTDKSLEELLQSLGDLTGGGDDDSAGSSSPLPSTYGGDSGNIDESSSSDLSALDRMDAKMAEIVEEMHEWRLLNKQYPFSSWSPDKQREMNDWVKTKFIPACTGGGESVSHPTAYSSPSSSFLGGFGRTESDQTIDVEATREAILSSPPVTRHDSEEFWSSLNDEQHAATLLDRLRSDGAPEGISVLHASFWDLDYSTQLQQLLNLGAIRPLLDEYTKESDRRAFLSKYGDVLMTGVSLEYLVPDPDGPITIDDLPKGGRNINQKLLRTLRPSSRYRLQTIPYRSSETGEGETMSLSPDELEVSRKLFKAWNKHKVNRAQYEETMFLSDRMGLTYDKPPIREEDMTYYDMYPEEREEQSEAALREERKNARRMERRKRAAKRQDGIPKWQGSKDQKK